MQEIGHKYHSKSVFHIDSDRIPGYFLELAHGAPHVGMLDSSLLETKTNCSRNCARKDKLGDKMTAVYKYMKVRVTVSYAIQCHNAGHNGHKKFISLA